LHNDVSLICINQKISEDKWIQKYIACYMKHCTQILIAILISIRYNSADFYATACVKFLLIKLILSMLFQTISLMSCRYNCKKKNIPRPQLYSRQTVLLKTNNFAIYVFTQNLLIY
jgi:hypothetical protein